MGNILDFEKTTSRVVNPSGKFHAFVETGSGDGASIQAAIMRFNRVISIEIVPETVEKMRREFKQFLKVEIVEGSSRDKLEGVLSSLNIERFHFVFLDAHVPGQFNYDLDQKAVSQRYSAEDKNPLHDEIAVCLKFPNLCVLIDDARNLLDFGRVETLLTDSKEKWEFRYFPVSNGYAMLIPFKLRGLQF